MIFASWEFSLIAVRIAYKEPQRWSKCNKFSSFLLQWWLKCDLCILRVFLNSSLYSLFLPLRWSKWDIFSWKRFTNDFLIINTTNNIIQVLATHPLFLPLTVALVLKKVDLDRNYNWHHNLNLYLNYKSILISLVHKNNNNYHQHHHNNNPINWIILIMLIMQIIHF